MHRSTARSLTMGTDDYDRDHAKIVPPVARWRSPKAALPGMAWQGYYLDTEGNVFGLHQPDPHAA